jgi:hypothetical protein
LHLLNFDRLKLKAGLLNKAMVKVHFLHLSPNAKHRKYENVFLENVVSKRCLTFNYCFHNRKWIANDDTCGICRVAFDGCCPDCKLPGDDCPVVWGSCTHCFHIHCIMKWINQVFKSSSINCLTIILAQKRKIQLCSFLIFKPAV